MKRFPHCISRKKLTRNIAVSLAMLVLSLLSSLANETPAVQCDPDWKGVTWETRYDQAKLARVRLSLKSGVPGQLAVIKGQEVTFTPANGQEVTLEGGWSYGGYVFDNWDPLLKILEDSVGGISIKQPAFTQNSNHQIFALSPGQQKALQSQKGTLVVKVICEMYQLHLRAKFSLDAPKPVQDGGILYQVVSVPTANKTGTAATPAPAAPADTRSDGEMIYLNGKRVTQAEALAMKAGNGAILNLSRKGTIDPTDQRPDRMLVYLLVNPEDHTGKLLQGVAPNGFFDRKRDPSKMDVVDHLGIDPDQMPLNHKILYVFDPLVGDTTETTVKDLEFVMHWP
jgi:hypothetical protein